MGKFDLEKYWDFRVWVKSQIAQLRALLSEYQQNGGGGGTGGGGGDFDPNGSYPNMSVGTATKATSATTADRATKATTADKAATADYATRADTAQKAAIADSALFADSAITADKATTADYATTAGQATTAESAKTATNADRATTAGHAITADVAESAEHAATASVATRATEADKATTADKATKDGGGKNIAENYALISDTVGKLGVLNSPADRSATIPNALTNAWGIDNTLFSVIIYERANSSATWVEKWNYATASFVQKTQVERGEATSNLFTSTRGYQVKVVVSTTTSNYIKALNLNIKTKDGTYSGNVDYTAYYGSSLTVAYNGSLGTWGANWSASFLETAAQNVEYIFNANRANASIVIRGYRICTNEPTNPTLIGKALKAYEADKATTADTATRANTAATAATAVNISDAPVLTATEDEQITVKVGNKTSNALTVPYAQRADFAADLSGRVEATPEVFTYRPSAGDKSIKDDNAFIRRVKGNSVAFNQIGNPLSANGGWDLNPEYGTVEYGDNYIKITSVSDSQAVNGMGLTCVQPLAQAINGHAYLMTVDMKPSKAMCCGFRNFADTWTGNNYDLIGGQWSNISYIVTCTSETTRYPYIGNSLGSQIVSGDTIEIKNLMIIDLTAMFGAGNEPTTVEEFRALYPNSYYPYNAGELRNLVCNGVKTVGFNEFNGTYARVLPNESYYLGGSYTSIGFAKELGGATETISIPSNRIYTPTQLGYIYATGTDICINLHHTGYRDGEYAPYKEVTHALPLSKITNGEPLRKAGGEVYDEINETEYIRRVGVRGYATGDKDDAALLTDGTYTNYPLDEPIVKPIETPIDFNYYVEDFGTEEAILAEDSAPFSADIVYQFNAVDNIRQNRISIQKLNDIFSGSKGEYVRADGSWGYIADLKGNFFVKPTLKRIRTGISELSDTIQIIHPYLTEHIGDAKIVLMAVKRRGGSYYDRATNAKGRRKKRKAWGELHYAAMPNTEINHNTIEMPNGASFEEWQNVILTACGRIPEGLENAREPYNVNVDVEDLAEFFATNGAIFVGKTPVIRLGVALRIPNPNFIDYGNGNKMWDYNDVTGKWEYKYLYSDVAEVVVKSQMLRAGGYVLGLELV